MKVSELIEKLSELNPDIEVLVVGSELVGYGGDTGFWSEETHREVSGVYCLENRVHIEIERHNE